MTERERERERKRERGEKERDMEIVSVLKAITFNENRKETRISQSDFQNKSTHAHTHTHTQPHTQPHTHLNKAVSDEGAGPIAEESRNHGEVFAENRHVIQSTKREIMTVPPSNLYQWILFFTHTHSLSHTQTS